MTRCVALSVALTMAHMIAAGCRAEPNDEAAIDSVSQAPALDADSAVEVVEEEPTAAPPTEEIESVMLNDLVDIEGLRERFNAATGSPRLILLLSPT